MNRVLVVPWSIAATYFDIVFSASKLEPPQILQKSSQLVKIFGRAVKE
jgi:hypothetical protein